MTDATTNTTTDATTNATADATTNATTTPFLLYGATGYTGTLIAEAAVAAGLRPILAGRNGATLAPLAERLGVPFRVAALDDPRALDAALHDVAAVLHCAGPFSATAAPMVDAALRTQRHYLDVTGEIAVFEALRARSAAAFARGVMLLPGVGFDVVPSDCLLAHVFRRLPSATKLTLTIASLGAVSHGTAATAIEMLGRGGLVRRHGALVPVPLGAPLRTLEIDGRKRTTMRFPWGDLATAAHSTGVGDIEVWFVVSRAQARGARMLDLLGPLLRRPAVTRFLQRRLPPGGPDEAARARGRSVLFAEATDDDGARARSRLDTRDGYSHTVDAALLCLRRVLAGDHAPGYQTPSSAYGPDLVLAAPQTTRTDLPSR
jgi:short subunit dehydrogenase-like uncharacterized protein